MKTTPIHSQSRSNVRDRSNARGVALVIVLSMLVLLSALLVAFMTTASTERSSAFANAGQTSARQLADSTVSLVISQIRDATTSPNDDTTWSSQPGAIRTFAGKLSNSRKKLLDNAYYDGYSPDATDSVYKLYSSDRLMVPASLYASSDLAEEVGVIESWDPTDPGKNTKSYPEYVDLNQPALSPRRDLDPGGKIVEPHYPIIDPRAKLAVTNADVLDADPGIVDGFDAKIARDKNLKMPKPTGFDGKDVLSAVEAKVPYLAMPVKWLYVLRDGTIGPASLGSEENPIVGRTAFWTDDETCKLNINTASEGTYWSSPNMSSQQECGNISGENAPLVATGYGLALASSQPARGEIQRYPGHPATTCLSPVLGQLLGTSATSLILPVNATKGKGTLTYPWLAAATGPNVPYRDFKQLLYTMTPFTPQYGLTANEGHKVAGTSYGATYNTDKTVDPFFSLSIRTKHLYTSVDQMLFKASNTSGSTNDLNAPLSPDALEKTRFFLTANSRAPELNIFSRPRITLWPISAGTKYRTSYDELFLFTSTIFKDPSSTLAVPKDKKFCMLRWDAKSSTADYTGQWNSSYAPNDDQNVKMYTYLQEMTSRKVPGFSTKTFLDKWGQVANGGAVERDQILTEIFDYVRTINIVDTGSASRLGNVFVPYTPQFYGKKKDVTYDPRSTRSYDWAGQVTPLRIGNNAGAASQGLGRFVTPIEVALVFSGITPDAAARKMQCALVIEMATAMPGFPGLRETYYTIVRPPKEDKGKNIVPRPTRVSLKKAGGQPGTPIDIHLCTNPRGLVNICNISSHEVGNGRGFMPTLGFLNQMHFFKEPASGFTLMQDPPESDDKKRNADFTCGIKSFVNTSPDSVDGSYKRNSTVTFYPYVSDDIPFNKGDKFNLEPGNFDIEIWSGENPDDPRRQLVQLVHVDFPFQPNDDSVAKAVVDLPTPTSTTKLSARMDNSLDGASDVIQGGDVVRSMELTCGFDPSAEATASRGGDVRLAAARADVPREYFSPREGETKFLANTPPVMHGLQVGHGDPLSTADVKTGGPQGRFGKDSAFSRKPPILPLLANGVKRADQDGPGDFDKGISKHLDGAFGNKVDEGNLRFQYGSASPQSIPYYLGRSIEETGESFFTPNRQISSSIMLGSMPTGVIHGQPWQTLLFRPNREATPKGHPGSNPELGPPDHLIADLFTIPVIEPYAISEPFSTAGKVNLNYVIAPFGYAKGDAGKNTDTTTNARSYLRRDTALRGVLKSEFIIAVPTSQSQMGHEENPLTGAGTSTNFRFPIFLNRTLEAMETRLKAKDDQYPLFRSASEICTVDLYPHLDPTNLKKTVTDWSTFWDKDNNITGDNMRERPYSHIYPRLTTRSNVYTVHMRTQAIRKSSKAPANEFDPTRDSVVGEYRGSATIERFVDPNDPALKDYDAIKDKVDKYYRYRVVNTKLFAPK